MNAANAFLNLKNDTIRVILIVCNNNKLRRQIKCKRKTSNGLNLVLAT